MFEKFAQADATDAGRKGGTGLGLSIVKEIVTRLGGTVDFEDAPVALATDRAMGERCAIERRADRIDVVRFEPYGGKTFAVRRDEAGGVGARAQANFGVADTHDSVVGSGLATHCKAEIAFVDRGRIGKVGGRDVKAVEAFDHRHDSNP
jgi:signal transduction histidine kinase